MDPTTADLRLVTRKHAPGPGAGSLLLAAAATGTIAHAAATAALAALARGEGRGLLQPVNATSHFVHGPEAGQVRDADLAHTAVGVATNHAAAIFWALPMTLWLARRHRRSPAEVATDAAVTAGVAAAVDYGLVPRRLTPGWEHAVSPRSVAATFGVLGLGLAAGAWITRGLRR